MQQMSGESSSVISHSFYIALVHTLLQKVKDHQNDLQLFWSLIELTTNILLLYKFGECETELLESFNATKDVSYLFVLARVFYDHAVTLVERHLVLRTALNSPETI